jgi:anaerobic magnesium-protoporphyrin IX monomethyl ester cyclase
MLTSTIMRFLFIYKEVTLTEPLGVLYLAAALKREGHETALALAGRRDFLPRARAFAPDVLAYSTTTGHHKYYLDLNRRLRADAELAQRPLLSIIGGPHATFFPEVVAEEGMDVACRGEGEEAMTALGRALAAGDDYRHLPNLWVKADGTIYENDVGPLVADLDTIAFADRDVLYNHDRYMREVPLKHFLSSRGCPYLCTYCFNNQYNKLYRGKGEIIRYRSVANVLAEIKEVRARYPLKFVRFLSDNFTMDKGWVREFTDRYSAEVCLPFNCHVRANLIDADVARDLGRAGCRSVLLGVESGDAFLRNEVLKRSMSAETIVAASRHLRENGVRVYTQNIVGLPGETFQQALATLELNQRAQPAFAWASIFMPYPGTPLATYAVEKGYFDGDFSRVFHTYHDHSVLKFADPAEGRLLANFHKLFGVFVEWPAVGRLARFLCSIPPNPLYGLVFKLWYGFTNRTRIFPYPVGFKDFLAGVGRFLRKDDA